MRILIDARKAFDSGIGTYIRSVVPRVMARLPEVAFSVLVEPGGRERHDYLAGNRIDFVDIADAPLGLREQASLRSVTRRADVFWATSLAHPLFSRVPLMATVHDVAQLATASHSAVDLGVKAAASVYFRSLRNTARLLLFNSAFTEGEFLRWVGTPGSASMITPLGVGPDWFTAPPVVSPPADRPPYLVCMSNMRPHKNLFLLLRAFDRVKDQLPHRLLLIGKAEALRATSDEGRSTVARLGRRLEFAGFLSDPDLRRCVSQADGLVVPSLYEGFGLPAIEAMAAGTPVIAARAGALPEVCGEVARYFDPLSVESLCAQLLQHAAMTDAERALQQKAGLERAKRFDWDHTAERTAEALRTTWGVRRP